MTVTLTFQPSRLTFIAMASSCPSPLRNALSTVTGLTLAVAGGFFLHMDKMPWEGAVGLIAVGLYLALPSRMQIVGTSLKALISNKDSTDGSV